MRYYLINPVLEEIEKGVVNLYELKKLSKEQTVLILNIIRSSMEQYNSEKSDQSMCRCGKCLKVLDSDEPIYSLEEGINKITNGSWWSEEIDQEVAYDMLCQECYKLMMQKYFQKVRL